MSRCVFVGIDWAYRSHAVCVIDRSGSELKSLQVSHDQAGLSELLRFLRSFGKALPVAIERPSGLLIDLLVEAGHQVFAIHPNAVKASRPRYRSSNAKSDASDAFMLADLLRTDGHRWQPLQPQSAHIRGLRALVRTRDDLVGSRIRLANQLTALLDSYWPGATVIFAAVDSPIGLAFIERWPAPRKLSARQIDAFCKRQGYSGKRPAAVLLQRLEAAAVSPCEPALAQAHAVAALALVAVLKPLLVQIKALERQIEAAMQQLPQAASIMSLPRAGCICAAQILAELGDVPQRFPTPERLAAEAGVVPVTYESGKSRSVAFRWACNHRLRRAITCLADNSRLTSPWAASVYHAARKRGCDHPHAVRILARAWSRVIWRIWTDGSTYNPALHTSAMIQNIEEG
ncbi:IS110 family transposase [Ramlibacter albus]|uniref:IS110 family transposase n=1 Tax=Ramlibacter albus TaxID=2079448 RepID=A0A923S5N6_9BURK|nr:IS110 family transposase [Ramlibacter albus]MBC5768726.1 IS110 family transposase [Ramlibacter albus]